MLRALDRIDSLQKRLMEANANKQELDRKVADTDAELLDVRGRMEITAARNIQMRNEINDLNMQLSDLNNRIEKMAVDQKQWEVTKQTLALRNGKLAKEVDAVRNDRQQTLLDHGESMKKLHSRLKEKIFEAQEARMIVKELAASKAELKRRLDEAEDGAASHLARCERLASEAVRHDHDMLKLSSQLRSSKQRIATLESMRISVETELKALQADMVKLASKAFSLDKANSSATEENHALKKENRELVESLDITRRKVDELAEENKQKTVSKISSSPPFNSIATRDLSKREVTGVFLSPNMHKVGNDGRHSGSVAKQVTLHHHSRRTTHRGDVVAEASVTNSSVNSPSLQAHQKQKTRSRLVRRGEADGTAEKQPQSSNSSAAFSSRFRPKHPDLLGTVNRFLKLRPRKQRVRGKKKASRLDSAATARK